jgi:tetratricopeptide (TPR) repeat protein
MADKPADFDKARQLAAAKQYPDAEKILKDIIVRLAGLEWDIVARVVLGREVYGPKGDTAAAVNVYEELFRVAPERKTDSQVMWAYREALLGAKMYDKLLPQLNELVGAASRDDGARAYVMRGDLKAAQQQTEPAALDYLRAAILFENEDAVQPEALFKAAQMLEKLRDPKAAGLYEKLKSKYPASPYAAKAPGR